MVQQITKEYLSNGVAHLFITMIKTSHLTYAQLQNRIMTFKFLGNPNTKSMLKLFQCWCKIRGIRLVFCFLAFTTRHVRQQETTLATFLINGQQNLSSTRCIHDSWSYSQPNVQRTRITLNHSDIALSIYAWKVSGRLANTFRGLPAQQITSPVDFEPHHTSRGMLNYWFFNCSYILNLAPFYSPTIL